AHAIASSPQGSFLLGCVQVANPGRIRPLIYLRVDLPPDTLTEGLVQGGILGANVDTLDCDDLSRSRRDDAHAARVDRGVRQRSQRRRQRVLPSRAGSPDTAERGRGARTCGGGPRRAPV